MGLKSFLHFIALTFSAFLLYETVLAEFLQD